MEQLRKNTKKEHLMDNFRPVTVLNAESKVLVERLAKRLALVIGEGQQCAITNRSIFDNLHLMRYIVYRVDSGHDTDGSLIK